MLLNGELIAQLSQLWMIPLNLMCNTELDLYRKKNAYLFLYINTSACRKAEISSEINNIFPLLYDSVYSIRKGCFLFLFFKIDLCILLFSQWRPKAADNIDFLPFYLHSNNPVRIKCRRGDGCCPFL